MSQSTSERLSALFGEYVRARGRSEFTFNTPTTFHAGHLFKACEILECSPEELFVEHMDGGSGCETCGPGPMETTLTVRRSKKPKPNFHPTIP